MGTVPVALARDLRRRLRLRHGVETGTWVGGGALLLSDVFPTVVTTIEVSEEIARNAAELLRREPIRVVHADSRLVLAPSTEPTFYFLDGHFMGGSAAEDDQCPLLEELDAIAGGHADDCIVIDDARLFTGPPAPPNRAEQWPTLEQIEERLARHWPDHLVVVAHDQIVAVPRRAADILERFAAAPYREPRRDRHPVRRAFRKARRLVRQARGG